jgi:ribonuclease T2
MSDIMPAEIIEHEWKEHGTCSGLSGDDYFALIRKAYESIRIPDNFKAPASSFSTSPRKLKTAFEQASTGLSDSNIVIQLNGNYLNAVEFCMAKGTSPSATSCSGVSDTHRGTFIVPPVK